MRHVVLSVLCIPIMFTYNFLLYQLARQVPAARCQQVHGYSWAAGDFCTFILQLICCRTYPASGLTTRCHLAHRSGPAWQHRDLAPSKIIKQCNTLAQQCWLSLPSNYASTPSYDAPTAYQCSHVQHMPNRRPTRQALNFICCCCSRPQVQGTQVRLQPALLVLLPYNFMHCCHVARRLLLLLLPTQCLPAAQHQS